MTDKQLAAHIILSGMVDLYKRAAKRTLTADYLKMVSGRKRMGDEKVHEICARVVMLMDGYMERLAKISKKENYIEGIMKEAQDGK